MKKRWVFVLLAGEVALLALLMATVGSNVPPPWLLGAELASADAHVVAATEAFPPPPGTVAFHLEGMEQVGNQLLFHVSVRNMGASPVTILGTQRINQFVVAGAVPPGTPIDEEVITLTAPVPADAPQHPALPRTLGGNETRDGWLEATLPHYSFTPTELNYRFGIVHTQSCNATGLMCQPADLYRVLVWLLPLHA